MNCALLSSTRTNVAYPLSDICLNGSWDFCFEEGKAISEVAKPDFCATDKISVPACFDMMPKWLCKRGTGLYRRTFTLDSAVDNAWLIIDGMGLTGYFSIDGKDLGTYPFPYARLEIETGALSAGEHTLFCAIDNRFDFETQKLARPYYDFYCYGGFYHGVSLTFDNRKLLIRTRDISSGTIEVEAKNFVNSDFDATLIFDGKNKVKASFKDSRAIVNVPSFKLWSPESPNLHTVTIEGLPSVKARFGIRTIEAHDRRLWLNGKPLYLKGANRHEAYPTFGAATPEALMVLDIQNLKALGGNFFRGCHYQQSQRFLDYCDEMGVLIWEESLGWGNGQHSPMAKEELTNKGFIEAQLIQTEAMVEASFNHPSVIIFAYLNEFSSGTEAGKALSDQLIQIIKAKDSGRLVSFACCNVKNEIACASVDLVSFNIYPGWIGTDAGDVENLKRMINEGVCEAVDRFRGLYPEKPIIVSEMGTCGLYGHRDMVASQWSEDFQAEYNGDVIDAVFANKEIVGLTIWQFTDSLSFLRGGNTIRSKPLAQNHAGLYDAYRRPKAVVPVVKAGFSRKAAGEIDQNQ